MIAHENILIALSVMTPNATLLSYTTPVDMRELRDQATLISMCWKDNANAIHNSTHQASSEAGSGQSHLLDTLTIEFDNANVIVRSLQERLLLVLVGGVPPNRQINFKATPEVTGDPRYPSAELKEEPPDIAQERASTSVPESSAQDFTATVSSSLPNGPTVMELTEKEKDIKLGILHIQRKKADALAAYIKGEFEGANIVMPDQVNDPLG